MRNRRSPARKRFGSRKTRNLARCRVHHRYPRRKGRMPMRRSHGPPWLVWMLLALAGGLLLLDTVAKTGSSSGTISANLSTSFFLEEEDDTNKPDYVPPANRSFTMSCASGSDSLGLHDGYVRGKKTKMRLCALPIHSSSEESTPGTTYYVEGASKRAIVSAPASYDYVRLLDAAKKEGITLPATSSFRTNSHQWKLWIKNGKNRAVVAEPGFSNHQQGAALDVLFSTAGNSVVNCDGWKPGIVFSPRNPCTLKNDKTWRWLNKNASKLGISQYYGEFWHFSPSGS